MNENVKDWYNLMYPSDELGGQLNEDVTFQDVWDATNNVLNVSDDIIIGRVFKSISNRLKLVKIKLEKAAPDLLAALILCRDTFDNSNALQWGDDFKAMDAAKTAILKATN